MTEKPRDMAEAMTILGANLDGIMADGGGKRITHRQHIALYTLIHDICACSKPNPNFGDKRRERISKGSDTRTNTSHGDKRERCIHLLGENLYHWLNEYLKQHLLEVHAEMITKSDDELAPFYIEQWKSYLAAAKYNTHLFRFLERHWVLRERDEGKTDVLEILPMHLFRWRADILDREDSTGLSSLQSRLESVTNDAGKDSPSIEYVTDSFVALGIREAGLQRQTSSSSLSSWSLVDYPGRLDGSTDG